MKLNALVMARSHSSVRTLVAAFAELGIEYQVSPSASETMEALATGYHSALIVDFDLPHAMQVVKMARMASGKRRSVLFGMVGAGKSVGDVFQAGANFVLYKPLDLLQVLHSLRATQGFMREDRRGSSRKKSETLREGCRCDFSCPVPLRWYTQPVISFGPTSKAAQDYSSAT